eukprot:COSAG05_NODE_881_length_6789_cov_21.387743_2_plen_62_part_00
MAPPEGAEDRRTQAWQQKKMQEAHALQVRLAYLLSAMRDIRAGTGIFHMHVDSELISGQCR